MDAGDVLDVLGDEHAFFGGPDRDDLGVGSRVHAAIAHVHGIGAALIEEFTGRVREHLVEQEPHGLRGHEVVAGLRSAAAFPRQGPRGTDALPPQ